MLAVNDHILAGAALLRLRRQWPGMMRHAECHHRRRARCRDVELSIALRAAAGAALSRVSDRHLARTFRRGGTGAAGAQRDARRGATLRARLLDRVRRARRQRQRDRLVVRAYSGQLAIFAGIAIIAMGLHFLGLTPIKMLMREKRLGVTKPVGLWGAYLMGLAFALGWTPCIGPILAAILAVAASESTVAKGAGMLAVYRSASACRLSSRHLRSNRSPPSWRAFALISVWSRRRWAGCWCSPASPFSPARWRGQLLAVGYFPDAGQDRLARSFQLCV